MSTLSFYSREVRRGYLPETFSVEIRSEYIRKPFASSSKPVSRLPLEIRYATNLLRVVKMFSEVVKEHEGYKNWIVDYFCLQISKVGLTAPQKMMVICTMKGSLGGQDFFLGKEMNN